jgi:hypothetical protein
MHHGPNELWFMNNLVSACKNGLDMVASWLQGLFFRACVSLQPIKHCSSCTVSSCTACAVSSASMAVSSAAMASVQCSHVLSNVFRSLTGCKRWSDRGQDSVKIAIRWDLHRKKKV